MYCGDAVQPGEGTAASGSPSEAPSLSPRPSWGGLPQPQSSLVPGVLAS